MKKPPDRWKVEMEFTVGELIFTVVCIVMVLGAIGMAVYNAGGRP